MSSFSEDAENETIKSSVGRILVQFGWISDGSRVQIEESWTHRSAGFYRCVADGIEQKLLVKLDERNSGACHILHDESLRVSRLLAEAAVHEVSVPRSFGWLSDPPLICMEFVDGKNLGHLIRRAADPAWRSLDLAQIVRSSGRTLGAFHAADEIREEGSVIRRSLRATRFFPSTVLHKATTGVVARSYADFALYNFIVTQQGGLFLIDQPARPTLAPIYEDIGAFILQLRRDYERPVSGGHPKAALQGLLKAFYEGYSETGPVDIRVIDQQRLVRLFVLDRLLTRTVNMMRRGNIKRTGSHALTTLRFLAYPKDYSKP